MTIKSTFPFLLGIYVLNLFVGASVNAQSLPVGTPVLEDYYRRAQLISAVDSSLSFAIRPITPVKDVYNPDSSFKRSNWLKYSNSVENRSIGFKVLPLTIQQQFNSHHPYGWNDGAMIPAKGYQTMVSAGVYFKVGILRIQFRPEFVYAANPKFDGFQDDSRLAENYVAYYDYFNQIDQPERLADGAYSRFFLGQSKVSLVLEPFELGLSNENIWWGPGIKNSLILSNTAPGFKHITFNSTKAVKTGIGFFEWQAIAGRLDGTGRPPLESTTLNDGTSLYSPKRNDWRYITGFNVNYHPKWLSGLAIGLTRTFTAYKQDVKGFSNYIPFFFPYQKQNTDDGDPIDRDQYTSLYARWLFRKAEAEVYFEFGRTDNSYNYTDFIGSPEHSRAYIFGFRKMLPLNGVKDQRLMLSSEITQMSQSPERFVREEHGWYMHGAVRDGYTNLGQILGAGIGSGGNLQSFEISWVSGLKLLGLGIDRYEHSVDFADNAFKAINGSSRKWVDFALGAHADWDYNNLLLSARLTGVNSLNYQWVLKDFAADQYYIPHNSKFNLYLNLGVSFRL